MFLRRTMSSVLLLLFFMLAASAQDMMVRTGCRRGTPRSLSALTRAQQASRTPGGDFYHGERHQLVVLVSFSDQQFQAGEEETLETWNRIFNEKNYSEFPYVGSVHDYFYDQSYKTFNLIFDLFYVPLNESRVKYRSTDLDDENSQYLVQDIMEELKMRDIEWSRYDWNDDGYVNQLLIVYAGKGMNDGGDGNTIWPHQWWMSEHQHEGAYCKPIEVSYDDKDYLVDCYCTVQEEGVTSASFGTICHEYSHCFGFPDFYNGSTKYVGSWDLMDYGNYNGDGYCPAGYSAHERWIMGWLTLTELTTETTLSNIPALSDEGQAFLVRNDGYANEYYIVENRQQQGWDEEMPGSGILIFHIDYDPYIWASPYGTPNSTYHQSYTIMPANNKKSTYQAAGWAYPYGDNDQLTNTSSPAATLIHENTDGTKLMNKPLTQLAVTGGLASFEFTNNVTGLSLTPSPGLKGEERYYTLDGRIIPNHTTLSRGTYIVRYANGEIKKVVKQ